MSPTARIIAIIFACPLVARAGSMAIGAPALLIDHLAPELTALATAWRYLAFACGLALAYTVGRWIWRSGEDDGSETPPAEAHPAETTAVVE